jgi:putative ABC transport system permease protein
MANAVMLDLIERRRELGILKTVGYTQKAIRGEVLLEYGIIEGVSALLVDLLVTPISNLIGNELLRATSSYLSTTGGTATLAFGMNGLLFAYLIIGAILLVTVTSLLASWRIVQIRPLEVLRYE